MARYVQQILSTLDVLAAGHIISSALIQVIPFVSLRVQAETANQYQINDARVICRTRDRVKHA